MAQHHALSSCADLWVVEEGVRVVDAPTSCPPLPLTMKQTLMPRLLQTQQFCVDLATDADISEPLSPVMKLHPTRQAQGNHKTNINMHVVKNVYLWRNKLRQHG